ncbi:hypothetical protein [Methylomagnum sp.]
MVPLRAAGVGMVALAFAGCVTVTTGGKQRVMGHDEFAKYVERVFRYHNQVMNDLIEAEEAREAQDSDEAKALSTAEAQMIEICQPLNEVVAESLSGKSVGLKIEMALAESVPKCEEASHIVDDLMP